MGKKRKKNRHERPAEMAAPLMGMAAGLLRQAATPQGRDAIASALRTAADAIGGARRWPGEQAMTPPAPPVPPAAPQAGPAPVPPVPPVPPMGSAGPDVARMVGLAGAALERWASTLSPPRDSAEPRKPH